jgi:hypothetical protein
MGGKTKGQKVFLNLSKFSTGFPHKVVDEKHQVL